MRVDDIEVGVSGSTECTTKFVEMFVKPFLFERTRGTGRQIVHGDLRAQEVWIALAARENFNVVASSMQGRG